MIAYDEIFARYDEYRRLLTDFRERVKANRLWYRQQQTEYQNNAQNSVFLHFGHLRDIREHKSCLHIICIIFAQENQKRRPETKFRA